MEGIRGIQHPLQTPIILDCIFKNLDIKDLQECRQVCRTWRHESGKAMRALVEVRIRCTNPRGPLEFLELVKNDESTFFQAPFADKFILTGGGGGVADCPEFWETCGAYIKSLRLHVVTFSSADIFRHAIFQSCPNLRKLEILRVQVCGELAPESMERIPSQLVPNRNLKSFTNFDFGNRMSVGWLEIQCNFPCVEKLHAVGMGDQFESVFRALEVARQHDANCWKLKDVALEARFFTTITVPLTFARVFGEGDPILTSLSIEGIAGDIEEDVATIQKLLVAHAHSLKKLAISQKSNRFPARDIFPLPGNLVLEKVQALKLIGVKMRSTRLLQAFPNLKKLMLDVDEIPEDTQTPLTLDDCAQLILCNQIQKIDDFKRLFGLLPNLKKLRIERKLKNEWFSLICENWPGLTHLEVADGRDICRVKVDDAGISGYDLTDVRKINKKGRRGSWRPTTVRRANLSSLKNLKSLFLSFHEESFRVGYCTEACGILELPQLKHLRVEWGEEGGDPTRPGIVVPVAMYESLSEQFPWDENQKITFDLGVVLSK